MPVFGELSDQDRNDVAAYIVDLQERNREVELRDFGGVGPVGEGLAAWLLALLAAGRADPLDRLGRTKGATPAPTRPSTSRASGHVSAVSSGATRRRRTTSAPDGRPTSGPSGRRSSPS